MIAGLPERLRLLRTQNNLTQKEISKLLGLSPSIVSGYETGERTPSLEVLLQLSGIYKTSTDYLLGKDKEPYSPSIDLSGLNPEQVYAVNVIVQSMKEKSRPTA